MEVTAAKMTPAMPIGQPRPIQRPTKVNRCDRTAIETAKTQRDKFRPSWAENRGSRVGENGDRHTYTDPQPPDVLVSANGRSRLGSPRKRPLMIYLIARDSPRPLGFCAAKQKKWKNPEINRYRTK